MDIRTGFGYDVHRFAEGRDLWLCGVKVPHREGLSGHSDADVALHALSDALLGAAALRDIGYHFPDTDPAYKGADSKLLLAEVVSLIKDKGYRVVNVDLTVCAEVPKLNPYVEEMRGVVAGLLEVDVDAVSIKATTTEGLGFVGHREGIAAYATCLICKGLHF